MRCAGCKCAAVCYGDSVQACQACCDRAGGHGRGVCVPLSTLTADQLRALARRFPLPEAARG